MMVLRSFVHLMVKQFNYQTDQIISNCHAPNHLLEIFCFPLHIKCNALQEFGRVTNTWQKENDCDIHLQCRGRHREIMPARRHGKK